MKAINPDASNKVPKNVIPIRNGRILHASADLDAYGGDWILLKHGADHFPGYADAPLKFVDQSPQLTDAQYDAAGVLPIDTGRQRFDHHRAEGRLPDSSAVKLVCEYVGVSDPATLAIAEEIHYGDNNPGISNTQLGGLVKSANHSLKRGGLEIAKWLYQALDVLHSQLTMHFLEGEGEKSGLTYFEAMVEGNWFKKDTQYVPHIRKLLNASIKWSSNPGSTPDSDRTYYTELDFIIRAMQRNGKGDEEICLWLDKTIRFLIADQVLFEKALKVVAENRNKRSVRALFDSGVGSIAYCMLHTDNPMSLSAANFSEFDLTGIRNHKGQVQIFLQRKTRLSLDTLVAMIRSMDADPATRAKLDWQDLMKDGIHPAAPNWHYDRKTKRLFNGSNTHPGVPPTQLESRDIAEAMINAFHPEQIERWMTAHKITVPTNVAIAA
jgi:hypothetical protein